MNPLSGTHRPSSIDFSNVAEGAKKRVFNAANEISAFFQSAVTQIGSRIQGLEGPTSAQTSLAATPATPAANAATLVQSQQALAPQNLRDYGSPHPNVRFAAGVDVASNYFFVTDVALPNGKATKWPEGEDAKLLRPDPSTYLDPQYMDEHLSMFDEGAISFVTPWAFEKFTVDGNNCEHHGREEGLFVLPAKWAKEVIRSGLSEPIMKDENIEPNVKSRKLVEFVEKKMGIPTGCWSKQNTKLLAVFIDKPRDLNLRFTTGREQGANVEWRPGGYTLGGVPEAMIDKTELNQGLVIPFMGLYEVLEDRALRQDGKI